MEKRAQGTFEYILLLGGVLLTVTAAMFILTSTPQQVDEQKQCAIAARSTLDCFYSNGTFRNESKFTFKGQSTPCNCTLYSLVPGGFFPSPGQSATPSPSDGPATCLTQGQGCNPSASSCCTGLSCTGGLPIIGGDRCQQAAGATATPSPSPTPTPTPTPACQNTPASCGQAGACQDCTQLSPPAIQDGPRECQNNNVVHVQTTNVAACQSQACSWQPTQTTVTDQTCTANEVCQNAACVPVQDVALIVSDTSTGLDGTNGLQFAAAAAVNAEEQAVENMLKAYSTLRVAKVRASDATYDNLKNFKTIVATDYYPQFTTAILNQLSDVDGKNVILFHDAMKAAYSAARPGGLQTMAISSASAFLENYDQTNLPNSGCSAPIPIQDPQTAATNQVFETGTNIAGWNNLASAGCGYHANTFSRKPQMAAARFSALTRQLLLQKAKLWGTN